MVLTLIVLVFLCCVSVAVGGYFVYQGMQKEKTQDLENQLSKNPGLHIFSECQYKGNKVPLETLPETAEDETIVNLESGLYSFILTDGYKIDTYDKPNLNGTKISYVGPQNTKCLEIPIKSFKFYKFEDSEESD